MRARYGLVQSQVDADTSLTVDNYGTPNRTIFEYSISDFDYSISDFDYSISVVDYSIVYFDYRFSILVIRFRF